MIKKRVHGIDHVGLTVPDIEKATTFFKKALAGEVIYDTFTKSEPKRDSPETQHRLGISPDMAQRAIRMLGFPNGPQIELFEYDGNEQSPPIRSSDLGWNHVAFYTDDIYATLEAVEDSGGNRLADPKPLSGLEAGDGNLFCYIRTPWGSTLELISYPTSQPYIKEAPREKWQV